MWYSTLAALGVIYFTHILNLEQYREVGGFYFVLYVVVTIVAFLGLWFGMGVGSAALESSRWYHLKVLGLNFIAVPIGIFTFLRGEWVQMGLLDGYKGVFMSLLYFTIFIIGYNIIAFSIAAIGKSPEKEIKKLQTEIDEYQVEINDNMHYIERANNYTHYVSQSVIHQ